ncbi:MAG: MBL fold metallo-hydrolase [Chloroflexi bacterium]|nr:MBL fold metallo-hydrolase [Chloroflexota bacterium]
MEKPYRAAPDVDILPSYLPLPIPGMGYISFNAFVLKAKEPVLIDTGMKIEPGEFMKALESVIDPKELKWIWLTHDDADHTGSVEEVLRAAPNARLVTNIIGVARMEAAWHIRLDQCHLLKQGESLDVGDRSLTAVRPPLFDSPATMGVYDDKTGVFFSSDCFGGFVPSPVKNASDIPDADLIEGFSVFNKANHPWVHLVDEDKFARALKVVQDMNPKHILSAHLPPASGRTEQFLKLMATLPESDPFPGLNQAEIEEMVAQFNAGNPPAPAG